jgi:uncharacterized protein (TIGR04255 family)
MGYHDRMTASREVYPNPPVALVAVEARHTASPPLTPQQDAALKAFVAEKFPIAQPVPTFTLNLGAGPAPPTVQSPPRFTNRERTAAVTFGSQAIVVETTHHENFDRLSGLMLLAAAARQQVAPVDGLERLGLRYIDEVRVPATGGPIDWSQWVEAALLGPAAVAARLGLQLASHQALASFQLTPERGLNLQYGPREGHAVLSGPLVRTPMPPASPFFLLDIDSFWAATDSIPELDPNLVAVLLGELHDPVNALFESLITDRLRREVLRHA